MYGPGSSSGGTNSNNGVQICVEPLCEWKIQEIAYDGFEKYLKPQSFNDLLRKNARRINWRKIVGTDASFDWASRDEEEEMDQGEKTTEADKQLSPAADAAAAAGSSTSTGVFEPVAGPWASVGKHLHHALQEVHILLDALRISSRTLYLNPLVNALVQDEQSEANLGAKNYQLCTRKRVLAEAARVIERMMRHRQMLAQDNSEEGNFTKELRELREHWRIRKVGSNIHGDLGYKTFAPKFMPNEVFDVSQKTMAARREATLRHSNPSYIALRLPHNLRRRARLLVFIEPDDETTAQRLDESNGLAGPNQTGTGPECQGEGEFRHVHWRRALEWAQETLIASDCLGQLLEEAVAQRGGADLLSVVTERSIRVAMFDGLLLRVQLQLRPFQEEQHQQSDGKEQGEVPFLAQCLRELYMAEQTNKPKRNQLFVLLPATPLPDSLDFRGPQGLSREEISARTRVPSPLLRRFMECASHHVLTCRVIDFLQAYMERFADPQPQWKWIRATPKFTLISLHFSNRGFENLGKFSSHIRISGADVTLLSKEAQQIACRRDMTILGEALLLLTATFLVNTLNLLSRAFGWQILHANINAFDVDGNPAPTFYACNQSATKNIFIQFHTDGRSPAIYMKHGPDEGGGGRKEAKEGVDLGGFHRLSYSRIPGSTFMRKIDNLLNTFID